MNFPALPFAFLTLVFLGILGTLIFQKKTKSQRTIILAGLIFMGALCLYAWVWTPHVGTNGDNAHYIVLAKSLLGGSFSWINHPDAPPETNYGFVFPLLLTPLLYFFPENYGLLKIVPLLLGLLSLGLIFYLFRALCGSEKGLVIMLLTAVSPHFLGYANQILTEIPYLFFSLFSLVCLNKYVKFPPWKQISLLGVAAGALAAFLTRSVGLILLVSILIYLYKEKQFVKIWAFGLPCLIFFLSWSGRNHFLANPEHINYFEQLLLKHAYAPELGNAGPKDFALRFISGAAFYGREVGFLIGGVKIRPLLQYMLSAVAFLGFIFCVKKKIGPVEIYSVLYLGTLFFWPWRGIRFIVVMLPFFFYFVLQGIEVFLAPIKNLKGRGQEFASKGLRLALVAGLLLLNLWGSFQIISQKNSPYSPPWANYLAMAIWAKDNTPEDSIIVGRKPYLLHLFSGRKTIIYPFTTDTEEMMTFINKKKVNYVLVDAFTWTQTTSAYLYPALQEYQPRFKMVAETDKPKVYLLKVED